VNILLSSIHIENIAVIKSADIELSSGFSVLTGETGAGKSIIIDSINLICGAKQSRELIRNGRKKPPFQPYSAILAISTPQSLKPSVSSPTRTALS